MHSNRALLFNPTRASSDELAKTFVGRHALLEKLVSDIAEDAARGTRRHWLLIGPRGSGKSHFSELLVRRMQATHGWLTARLPEEHYQIATIADLLEQILARATGRASRSNGDYESAEDRAIDSLHRLCQEHGRPILAIVENLGFLFDQISTHRDQAKLRSILMGDSPIVLVATSTSYVDATVRHEAPFYDFFNTIPIDDLTREDVIALVRARAEWDGAVDLLKRFAEVAPRLDALFHLSGGNPRLVLALYAVLREGVTDELHTQVVQLLDEVTPYFQSRLRDISPQAVRILVAMALARGPIEPAEIGRRTRMPTNQVTAQIRKLLDERMVVAGGRPSGRSRFYEVRDRIFRLWIQMREDPTTDQRLRFVTEFFQRWYAGQSEELVRDAESIATAFWRDLSHGNNPRCSERLTTLKYLADASRRRGSRFVLESLSAHFDATSEADLKRDSNNLLMLYRASRDIEDREYFGYLVVQSLFITGRRSDGLKVLDELVANGSKEVLIVTMYLEALIEERKFDDAWQVGERLLKQEDRLGVTEAMAIAACHRGHPDLAVQFAREYVAHNPCVNCRARIRRRVSAALFEVGRESEAMSLFRGIFADVDDVSPEAVEACFRVAVDAASDDDQLLAARCWHSLPEAPSWFLQSGVCRFAHKANRVRDAMRFIEATAKGGGGNLPLSTLDHLVEILATFLVGRHDAPPPELGVGLGLLRDVNNAEKAFRRVAPRLARSQPELRPAILALYEHLRRNGILRQDIEPYAEASAVLHDPDPDKRLIALHPEIREAVQLLLAGPASSRPMSSGPPDSAAASPGSDNGD